MVSFWTKCYLLMWLNIFGMILAASIKNLFGIIWFGLLAIICSAALLYDAVSEDES